MREWMARPILADEEWMPYAAPWAGMGYESMMPGAYGWGTMAPYGTPLRDVGVLGIAGQYGPYGTAPLGAARWGGMGLGGLGLGHMGLSGLGYMGLGGLGLGGLGLGGMMAPWAMGAVPTMARQPIRMAARPDTAVPMVRELLHHAGMEPAVTPGDTVAVAETPDLSGVAELPGWRGVIDLPFLRAGVVLPTWRLIWDWPGARLGLKADVDAD